MNHPDQTQTAKTRWRAAIYAVGLLILALGLTLNTKAGLGVSAIISVSYCISLLSGIGFGDMTLLLYAAFVVVELVLHSRHTPPEKRRRTLLLDLLQFPLSLAFTRVLNVFDAVLPDFGAPGLSHLTVRLPVLLLAIVCTGVGAAMSLSMRLVPNPGDGIVQAIADRIGKGVGFTKNAFDLFNILLTITLGLIFAGRVVGVGLGTVLAVIGVGRIIALFLHLTRKKLTELTGIPV